MSSTHQWFAYCSTPLHLSAVVSWSVDRRGGRGGGKGGRGRHGEGSGGGGSGLLQPEMGLFLTVLALLLDQAKFVCSTHASLLARSLQQLTSLRSA